MQIFYRLCFYVMMDISSRSRLSVIAVTTFPKYLKKACLTSSGSSSRLEWISCSLLRFEAALKREKVSLENKSFISSRHKFYRSARRLPKCSLLSSTSLPGLWWATSRHCLSCKLWVEMNMENQVSISLRWLGTSGLKITTTPLQSFISAGQHDSNLHKRMYQHLYNHTKI